MLKGDFKKMFRNLL